MVSQLMKQCECAKTEKALERYVPQQQREEDSSQIELTYRFSCLWNEVSLDWRNHLCDGGRRR